MVGSSLVTGIPNLSEKNLDRSYPTFSKARTAGILYDHASAFSIETVP